MLPLVVWTAGGMGRCTLTEALLSEPSEDDVTAVLTRRMVGVGACVKVSLSGCNNSGVIESVKFCSDFVVLSEYFHENKSVMSFCISGVNCAGDWVTLPLLMLICSPAVSTRAYWVSVSLSYRIYLPIVPSGSVRTWNAPSGLASAGGSR